MDVSNHTREFYFQVGVQFVNGQIVLTRGKCRSLKVELVFAQVEQTQNIFLRLTTPEDGNEVLLVTGIERVGFKNLIQNKNCWTIHSVYNAPF